MISRMYFLNKPVSMTLGLINFMSFFYLLPLLFITFKDNDKLHLIVHKPIRGVPEKAERWIFRTVI